MSVGGVAVFGADTVYGLACDVHNRVAVERLCRFKRRPLDKPSAVMFFDVELALAALPELGPRVRDALGRLLPGAVTVLLPNPERRFPLACGEDGATLGLRVPVVPSLAGARWPVLQSSANLAGGPEARRLQDVPEVLRRSADLVLDAGELPGTASTIIDLRAYEESDSWQIVRAGAVSERAVKDALSGQFHFDPAGYLDMIKAEIPVYERFQDEVVAASGDGAARVLELGTGTGETTARLLERHREATVVGIDESEAMLAVARERLPAERVSLRAEPLQSPLPPGPFDLIVSALCVHHLETAEKRDLFARVRAVLADGGRFVLGDVIIPDRPADAVTPLTAGFDRPSTVADHLAWLAEAGLAAQVCWKHRDLVVLGALLE
jgi:tRNA threonylcarbamoyl adenosine modification protein (Sua5/YciO/YrdC/YwlC family)